MDQAREKQLVDLLNKYDVSGVKFNQAKKELLAKGYSEAEVVYALYSAPFDGRVNQPRPANPLNKFYQEHPDQADKLARKLILADEENTEKQAVLNAGASELGPDIQSKSYYEVRTADVLGVPYFTLVAINFIILAIILKLNIQNDTANLILAAYNLFFNAIFAYKFIQQHHHIANLKKQIKEDG